MFCNLWKPCLLRTNCGCHRSQDTDHWFQKRQQVPFFPSRTAPRRVASWCARIGYIVSSVSWVADLRNELHARSGSQKPISKKAKNVWSTRAGTCRKIHCQSVVAGAFCCAVMRENASVPEIPAASKNRIFTAGKIIGWSLEKLNSMTDEESLNKMVSLLFETARRRSSFANGRFQLCH